MSPAVQQNVVMGPHQPVTCRGQANHGYPEQWWAIQVERDSPLGLQHQFESGMLLLRWLPAAVDDVEGEVGAAQDGLAGIAGQIPGKARAQDLVVGCPPGQGSPHPVRVERTCQRKDRLFDEQARVRTRERAQKETLLGRCRRVECDDGDSTHELSPKIAAIRARSSVARPEASRWGTGVRTRPLNASAR